MKQIRFDFNNMFDFNVGRVHGVSPLELEKMARRVNLAHVHLQRLIKNPVSRVNLGLEWTRLPFQDKERVQPFLPSYIDF